MVTTDTLLGIVTGAIIALVFYFKSKSVRLPTFVYHHELIQTKSHPEIEISYHGEKIDNLSRSKILFLNKGRKEIRAQDKPQSGFPKVVFPDGTRILSVIVLASSSHDIAFRAEKQTDTTLELSYEYLNKDDGGIVEVFFDGKASSDAPIGYKAPLMGAEPVLIHEYVSMPSLISHVAMFLWSLAVSLFSLWVFYHFGVNLLEKGEIKWDMLMSGVITMTMGVSLLWSGVINPYRCAVPDWARSYF